MHRRHSAHWQFFFDRGFRVFTYTIQFVFTSLVPLGRLRPKPAPVAGENHEVWQSKPLRAFDAFDCLPLTCLFTASDFRWKDLRWLNEAPPTEKQQAMKVKAFAARRENIMKTLRNITKTGHAKHFYKIPCVLWKLSRVNAQKSQLVMKQKKHALPAQNHAAEQNHVILLEFAHM